MRLFLALFDRVAFDAVARPAPRFISSPSTRVHRHLLGDHEGGIETNTELADDIEILALILGVFGLEFLASRMSDRAEILFKFGFRHADARVFYGDRARVFVERNGDEQVVFCDRDRRVGKTLEIELVDRIRGVRDKFAQEDLTIRVDRVDHEIEQFLALSFELLHV